jgi:uncharacterized membrane protein
MNLTNDLFPSLIYWLAHLLFLVLLAVAIKTAPWKRMRENEQMHVFLGGCVALLVVWTLKAGIHPGLNFHLLGGTLFMLMFGWQFAILGLTLVVAGVMLNGSGDWQSFSLNVLLMAGIPVLLGHTLLRLAVRRLPHNFFIYAIFNGFFAGGLSMVVTVLTAAALLVCCGPYSFDWIAERYLIFIPMMAFAEGFFTGMIATGMALFRPEWISTYDDKRYIVGK